MNVLFDVAHPAQVHLFRHAIAELESRGHRTLVTSREKEITTDLLDAYGIDHRPLSTAADGTLGLVAEWGVRECKMLWAARSFDPDVVVSRLNPAAVHVSRLLGARNVILFDTVLHSPVLRTAMHRTTLPFVDDICVPPGFDLPVEDDRVHTLDFQELAYLHPDRFEPDREALAAHGVDPDEPYFVLRFAGWDAYHDVGNRGLSPAGKRELIAELDDRGEVYITSEDELPADLAEYRLPIPAHRVHDLLAFADLYVGDSQTMPTEAALLGTPALRVNSMVGEDDMHNFVELEEEYGLLFSYADEDRALAKAIELADAPDADATWERRRQALVADKADVTGEILDLVLDDPAAPAASESTDEDRRVAGGAPIEQQ